MLLEGKGIYNENQMQDRNENTKKKYLWDLFERLIRSTPNSAWHILAFGRHVEILPSDIPRSSGNFPHSTKLLQIILIWDSMLRKHLFWIW